MTVYILTAQKEIETTISTYKHEIVTFVIKTFIGVYSDKKMALRDAKALKKKNLEKENKIKWWQWLINDDKYVTEIGLTYVVEEQELNEEMIDEK